MFAKNSQSQDAREQVAKLWEVYMKDREKSTMKRCKSFLQESEESL